MPIDIAQVEELLSLWAAVQMGGGGLGGGGARGYGGRTPGFTGSRGLASENWSAIVYDEEDRRTARIVGAAVGDLPQHEQDALWRAYGLCSVWTYKRLDYDATVASAKQRVGEGLVRRGVPV